MQDSICQAIKNQRLLQFEYEGETRVVEPYQLGYKKGLLILSAYWIRGYSKSMDLDGWRSYYLNKMTSIVALDEPFSDLRDGYMPAPNKMIQTAVCEL